MYDGQVTCPVIIRTPSGGGRGYGPTHSQSLEKHFLGVPHLKVVAASLVPRPDAILCARCSEQDSPVLYVEHKLLYPQHLVRPSGSRRIETTIGREQSSDGVMPTVVLSQVPSRGLHGHRPRLRVLRPCSPRRCSSELAVEEEIFGELVVPAQIAPHGLGADRGVGGRAPAACSTVEEGTAGWSWGTEVAARDRRRAFFGGYGVPSQVVASDADRHPEQPRRSKREVLVGSRRGSKQAIREAAA